jgi:hypothetical protein
MLYLQMQVYCHLSIVIIAHRVITGMFGLPEKWGIHGVRLKAFQVIGSSGSVSLTPYAPERTSGSRFHRKRFRDTLHSRKNFWWQDPAEEFHWRLTLQKELLVAGSSGKISLMPYAPERTSGSRIQRKCFTDTLHSRKNFWWQDPAERFQWCPTLQKELLVAGSSGNVSQILYAPDRSFAFCDLHISFYKKQLSSFTYW